MLQNTAAHKYYYSLKTMADFKGRILENGLTGLVLNVNEQEVHFRLIGEFNAYNLLAVYGAAICLGEDKHEVLRNLSVLTGAEGRFEYVVSAKERIIGIVDYAHTPDALLNVLSTIKNLRKGHEQVITVVGCGGDRDRTKRPVMAEVANEYSDRVIITSDNPRTEDPLQIIKDMEQGLNTAAKRKTISIADRREAIKTAISLAGAEDIVLIAGKGHEKYQDINGVKYHFDDKEELLQFFDLLEKEEPGSSKRMKHRCSLKTPIGVEPSYRGTLVLRYPWQHKKNRKQLIICCITYLNGLNWKDGKCRAAHCFSLSPSGCCWQYYYHSSLLLFMANA